MTDFTNLVARIAASLLVVEKTTSSSWSHWTLRNNPATPGDFTMSNTWVVQGPAAIIVTGDMASMIFERPGGLALRFLMNGFRYIAEKCTAGNVDEYDADLAEREFEAHMEERLAEADPARAATLRALLADDGVNFQNEGHLGQWYHDNIGDETPCLGRKPSSTLIRALACIEAVIAFEGVLRSA